MWTYPLEKKVKLVTECAMLVKMLVTEVLRMRNVDGFKSVILLMRNNDTRAKTIAFIRWPVPIPFSLRSPLNQLFYIKLFNDVVSFITAVACMNQARMFILLRDSSTA